MNNGLTKRDRETIWAILGKFSMIERVNIFGSRAKASFKAGSDIDLVILNKGMSYLDLIRLKSAFDDSNLPYSVDVLYYSEISNGELKAHIDRVGKPFYERNCSPAESA